MHILSLLLPENHIKIRANEHIKNNTMKEKTPKHHDNNLGQALEPCGWVKYIECDPNP